MAVKQGLTQKTKQTQRQLMIQLQLGSLIEKVTFKKGYTVETSDVERVFKLAKKPESAGIGVQDQRECLMLQLERKDDRIIYDRIDCDQLITQP